MSFFLTGSDTGVGKTHTAACLLRLARASGARCAGMKPICCGDRYDAELLLAASSDGLTIDELNPVWLRTPAAPLTAATREGVALQPERLLAQFSRLQQRFEFVVVEGVGGWMVPIHRDYFISDLAVAMKLPILIVVANRLGCLNHAMLTLQNVEARGLVCAGIVLNSIGASSDIAIETNRETLTAMTDTPILPGLSGGMTELPAIWRELDEKFRAARVNP